MISPTCFGPFEPSSGSFMPKLAKVTIFFLQIFSKDTSLNVQQCWLKCFKLWCVLCAVQFVHGTTIKITVFLLQRYNEECHRGDQKNLVTNYNV